MKYKLDFNKNLGVLPVSLFIDIDENDKKIKIFEVWDKVQEYNCRDIIFYGNIGSNIQELNFLTSRLIANMYYASVILPDTNYIMDLTASRLIVFFLSDVSNSTYFKQNVTRLMDLRENDIIIIHPSSMKELSFVRTYFINNKVRAKIMVEAVSEEELLNNKIYDIYPYGGLNV